MYAINLSLVFTGCIQRKFYYFKLLKNKNNKLITFYTFIDCIIDIYINNTRVTTNRLNLNVKLLSNVWIKLREISKTNVNTLGKI